MGVRSGIPATLLAIGYGLLVARLLTLIVLAVTATAAIVAAGWRGYQRGRSWQQDPPLRRASRGPPDVRGRPRTRPGADHPRRGHGSRLSKHGGRWKPRSGQHTSRSPWRP